MNIVLGVCGSIAAYRAADLARDLMRAGHTVRVCLTDAAQRFVTPLLFETLTGEPCLTDTFEEPVAGRMAHIDWARWADAIVVAPASANTIDRLANGIAEDMLTTIALATDAPWVIAPAMNPSMYASEPVRRAMALLESRAARIVEPQEGDVVAGEHGAGKLAANAEIAAAVAEIAALRQTLIGKRVLITSGPTQEPIDSVRYLSNRSSGKMGAALARAARLMGGTPIVVAGPQEAPLPYGTEVIRVQTALQMRDAALSVSNPDLIIGAAAVADYRVENPAEGKIRRNDQTLSLNLVPNPDIIAELARRNPNARTIAFAAEPGEDDAYAREKMARKGVFAIAANDVSRSDIGFGSDFNEIRLLFADGRTQSSGRQSKLASAAWLLAAVTNDPRE